MKERANVRDERTGAARYFVYIEREGGGAIHGAVRFNSAARANRVAAAINKALDEESRLLVPIND